MSLDLDTRQRAMLEEMGVTFWWPEPSPMTTPDALADAVRASQAPSPARAIGQPAPATSPAASAPSGQVGQAGQANQVGQGTTAPAVPTTPAPRRPVHTAEPSSPRLAQPIAGPVARSDIAALDWSTLQQAVAGCRACTLCETRRNTVFGVGQAGATPEQAPQVDWMVVGEAPGENEDVQGEPFVGAAGKLLDNMLKALGVSRSKGVYIANVLKCRPPGNRNPAPEEIAQCAPFLQRQIALLRPRVILAVGRFAVQTLLADSVPEVQTTPLGRLRGRVYRYQGVPVVVTYHPAYLLRSLPEKAKAWADLCLALRVLNTPPQASSDPA